MGINNIYAYVDEYGTPNINTGTLGVTTFYIATAVVIEENNIGQVEDSIKEFKKTIGMDGSHEIKSNNIGSNHEKRKKILNFVKDLPIKFYSAVIDKRYIRDKTGLSYERSFYKYVSNQLYSSIEKSDSKLFIRNDKIKSKSFQDGIRNYFRDRNDFIFQEYINFDFDFIDSKNSNLIQVADVISGSLAFAYEPSKLDITVSKIFLDIIKPIKGCIYNMFNDFLDNDTYNNLEDTNKRIYNIQKKSCIAYLDKYKNYGGDINQIRHYTLRMLMSSSYIGEAIYKKNLIEEINNSFSYQLGDWEFMREVIGNFRLNGIIITGSHKGYNIAYNLKHISQYIIHDKKTMYPMLEKLVIAEDILDKLGIKLLEKDKKLKKIINSYKNK